MPQDNIEAIKSKLDVVEVLSEYIQMKPAGSNNFKALCPFHGEKTPSFMISKDKQIWHCFGCGEGGDIFGFVMRMEGMEFPEALRHLAQKAGVQLQYQDPTISNKKTLYHDICRNAAEFYHAILVDHPKAQFVRDYLAKRGVSQESIKTWQLGYAPEGWDTLNNYLVQKKSFKEEDIFQAGMTVKKDRGAGYNDRFHKRLMFPIWDNHGTVIGFGGRWLGTEKDMAKYVNTPQTLIYNKSQVLYGIDKAKAEIKKQKFAVVVEGYMDCLASHQAGVTNVVAASGTALTSEQVKLLKRFTTEVRFAFDQDLAGDTAAKRGITVAWQEDMATKIITVPEGKDPDELIQKDPALWNQAIADAQSIMEYYMTSTVKQYDASTVEGKKKIAKVVLPIIAMLADTIEQTHYLQKLAGILQVEEQTLRDKVRQIEAGDTNPKRAAGPVATAPVLDRSVRIAERLVGIGLERPELLPTLFEHLLSAYISHEKLHQLYKLLNVQYTKNQNFTYQGFIQLLRQEDSSLATYADLLTMQAVAALEDLNETEVEHEVTNGAQSLKRHYIQQQLKSLEQQMRAAESRNDRESLERLSLQFADLAAELHQAS
ncbi:MAG: DNA primase [Candidatus Kerfeldbacteria bacterium]|nr:DNA primase [Candidatus Kerfeldbacteria bacterium]